MCSAAEQLQRGVIGLEVHVRKDDAGLIREVAKALYDPVRATEARALLRSALAHPKQMASRNSRQQRRLRTSILPRERDLGRNVALRNI